jgi:hypothetical protein
MVTTMADAVTDGYWWVTATLDTEEFVVKVEGHWVFMAGVSGWAKVEDFTFIRRVQ